MLAVGTGALAGILFGLLTTLVRRGLIRQPNALVGAMVITSTAALIVLVVTVVTGSGGRSVGVAARVWLLRRRHCRAGYLADSVCGGCAGGWGESFRDHDWHGAVVGDDYRCRFSG